MDVDETETSKQTPAEPSTASQEKVIMSFYFPFFRRCLPCFPHFLCFSFNCLSYFPSFSVLFCPLISIYLFVGAVYLYVFELVFITLLPLVVYIQDDESSKDEETSESALEMNGEGESSQQLKLEDSKEGNIATAAASALAAAAVKAKVCRC